MGDIFTDPEDWDRLDAERHSQTFEEIRSEVSRALEANTIGGNFTAMGVQLAARAGSLRLLMSMMPEFNGTSLIGKIQLTDKQWTGSVHRVARVPKPFPKCCYTTQELCSKLGHSEPNAILGVFTHAMLFVDEYSKMQRRLHPDNFFDDESEDHIDNQNSASQPTLPAGNVLDVLEFDASSSWPVYQPIVDARNQLTASISGLLEFSFPPPWLLYPQGQGN